MIRRILMAMGIDYIDISFLENEEEPPLQKNQGCGTSIVVPIGIDTCTCWFVRSVVTAL